MPTWSGILQELVELKERGDKHAYDVVRRKYLTALYEYTDREVILYASKCTQPAPNVSPNLVSIIDEDLQALMEVIHGLSGPKLDLILHSPGGSLEAAEAFVVYLRSKFGDIRVIIPHLAMSAATMIACAGDVLLMGKHSFLGPVDPQLMIETPLGQRMVPAQAILDQFRRAQAECEDPSKLGAWLPMLGQYGPDLLVQCENASSMSAELVQSWLARYMFRDAPDASKRAESIAQWLSTHEYFRSHARHIPRRELEEHGLKVMHLEDDGELQDLSLSVFHATTHTFDGTTAVKIVENHRGKAFIKSAQVQRVVVQPPEGGSPPPAPPWPPAEPA